MQQRTCQRRWNRARALALALSGLLALAGAPAAADPPDWAPAHGYRHKHKGQHKHRHGHYHVHEHRRVHERRAYPVAVLDLDAGECHREVVGGLLGGAVGGALGSQVGKGDGRLAATAAGAVLGYLVGGSIGRSMDRADRYCAASVLEHTRDHTTVAWGSADHGRTYRITPVETWTDRGRQCREFLTDAVIGGRRERVYGTACREPDGTWQAVN